MTELITRSPRTRPRRAHGAVDRADPWRDRAHALDVSIVVPTRDEEENVLPLTERLEEAMSGIDVSWELLFVDDSDDSTTEIIAELSARDPAVSLVHRPRRCRRGGLAGAVVAGLGSARGRVVVVMDGDLQHPPDMARELGTPVLSGSCDVAIASRYVPGASADGLDGGRRRLTSRLCTTLVHALVPRTRRIKDPMSGFFAVSRQAVDGVALRPHGFKILMEILAKARYQRVFEVPFRMDARAAGDSKAGLREGARFLRHLIRLARPTLSQAVSLVRWLVSTIPLGVVLAGQAWLTTRLIQKNTAFIDEGTYMSAGHYMLHWWAHGGPNLYLQTYFSGSPAIYPPLAAMVDHAGGLQGVRLMSMAFMLLATVLAYGTARRLFGRPAGWLAAALFVTTQGALFLGALATYDAMALMLIALASWMVVRSAVDATTRAWIFLASPVLVLANATKYASAIFDPVVLALAFFALLDRHGLREAVRRTMALFGAVVLGLSALLAMAPAGYLRGILWTTLNRNPSNNAPHVVLLESWSWVGAIAIAAGLAVVAGTVTAWRHRISWATVGVLAVLAGAVALAPLEQARIHTLTSLNKHVTFGAWFGAIGAGWLLYRLGGRRLLSAWRYGVVCIALVPLLTVGYRQADLAHRSWPNAAPLISVLRPLVAHQTRPVLMDQAEVARYYLEDELSVPKWQDTFYFAYRPPGSNHRLTGPRAYASAVSHGYFSVIALDFGRQIWEDRAASRAVNSSHRYAWVANVTLHASYGTDTYVVWRLKDGKS